MSKGRVLALIGHFRHPEVEGTMGQVPGPVTLVQDIDDVAALALPADTPMAYVTQATLSVDDTENIIAALKRCFTDIQGPDIRDICYATQNRQSAVRGPQQVRGRDPGGGRRQQFQLQSVARNRHRCRSCELSDCRWQRAEPGLAERHGRRAHRAGASAPEVLVDDVIEALRRIGPVTVSMRPGREENIEFRLPAELAAC
jgi:4-hydroxy-3-methylbut-2-enyl diphosphate reductase